MAYQKLQAYRALTVFKNNDIDIPNPAMLAISSTTTATSAGKLVDSAGDFINKGVKIGDIIYNITQAVPHDVTAIDSATELSVTGAPVSGDVYKLYANVDAPNNGCVLYVGGAGNLDIITAGGDNVLLTGVLAGSFIPVQVTRVKRSSTTATDIVALW